MCLSFDIYKKYFRARFITDKKSNNDIGLLTSDYLMIADNTLKVLAVYLPSGWGTAVLKLIDLNI